MIAKFTKILKRYSPWQIAVMLSSVSLGFGALRELLIVSLLGFSEKNDTLQIYLSIFYITSLNVDAIRLSCLNLYKTLSLSRMAVLALAVSLVCSLLTCLCMTNLNVRINGMIMLATIIGSSLHLLASLLITYRQQQNLFLKAQVINVLPNAFLIPGIVICYLFSVTQLVAAIVVLTSIVPAIQCILLMLLRGGTPAPTLDKQSGVFQGLTVFARHFSTMAGEQLFQMIARAAFLHYGHGYLSMYALTIRLYSAFRFIAIDSWIGSKLHEWKTADPATSPKNGMITGCIVALLTFGVSAFNQNSLPKSAIQMGILLLCGFYFTALVRIFYFRINQQGIHRPPVMRFAFYEMAFALLAYWLTRQVNYPLLALLWIGYIAKPFSQLLMLKRHAGSPVRMEFS